MRFKQHLITIEMDAAFINIPESLIQNVTQLLSEQLDETMATPVRRTVTFKIGACVVPVFSLMSGGTGELSPSSKMSLKTVPLSSTFAPSPMRSV